MTVTATITKMRREFSQAKFDRYVTQQIRSMSKARARGHRDFKHMTDAQIQEGAQFLARTNNAGEIFVPERVL